MCVLLYESIEHRLNQLIWPVEYIKPIKSINQSTTQSDRLNNRIDRIDWTNRVDFTNRIGLTNRIDLGNSINVGNKIDITNQIDLPNSVIIHSNIVSLVLGKDKYTHEMYKECVNRACVSIYLRTT